MTFNNSDDNTILNHDFSERLLEDDLAPVLIKPYSAVCRRCWEPFPYHRVLFPHCPNPDCIDARRNR
jgi:hypothetical protein